MMRPTAMRSSLALLLVAAPLLCAAATANKWAAVPMAPADPILGVAIAYKADSAVDKVNLGIGAYRTSEGKPLVLKCVREAEKKMCDDLTLDKEYLPMQGLESFLKATSAVILGSDSKAIEEGRVAVLQTLSGTGALRVAGEFIAGFAGQSPKVYISDPSWGNHHTIFQKCGMETTKYRYISKTMTLDIDGMLEDLKAAPKGSVFVLHTIAHNPTGVDPTEEQWKLIADVCEEREAILIFDTAYQGYATGDLEKDAWAVRYFADERGMELMVTQSYSKNFGLYGERIGALNVVTRDNDTAKKVRSQLCAVVRPMYSSPQIHGARLVSTVLGDRTLKEMWQEELVGMSNRIVSMRTALVQALAAIECPVPSSDFKDWCHITSQIGMFAYTGLNEAMCDRLTKEHHIYCTRNGRFSMAGVTPSNVDRVAAAIKDVIANA